MKLCRGLLAALLIATPALAAPPENAFRYWKPVDRAAAKDEEIIACGLDSDIYAATRGGFPDLRVVDDKSAEVPCQVEAGVEYGEDKSRGSVEMKTVALHPNGNTLEVHVRLPDDAAPAEGLTIATPLANYERKVRVLGSADGAAWTQLADAVIFDFARYMDVSNRDVALPKNSFREFRVIIEDVADESESPYKELTRTFRGDAEDQRTERTTVERRPFRIDRITAWYTATRERVRQSKTAVYPVAGFEPAEDAAAKQTVVTVHTRREPITRLTLETPGRNFSRHALVQTPVTHGDKTDWATVAEGPVFNFSFRNLRREGLSINFPERRDEQFRIVIRNEDNPAINITGVRAEGVAYRVVFLAQPDRTYRVFYGSPTADAPKYEAATVLATLRRDFQPVTAQLGAQSANAAFGGAPTAAAGHLLDNWVFLGTAIALMVVVLGWALFRAGKRLDSLPKENADQP